MTGYYYNSKQLGLSSGHSEPRPMTSLITFTNAAFFFSEWKWYLDGGIPLVRLIFQILKEIGGFSECLF
jgi:hypothetical protein